MSLFAESLLLGVLSGLLIGGTALVATLHPITSSKEVAHHPRHAFAREVRQGIGAAWHDPRPRLLCGIIGLTSFELGVIDVVIVVLAFEILGTGETGVGLLNTANVNVTATLRDPDIKPGSRVSVQTTYSYDPFFSMLPLAGIQLGSRAQGVIAF